MRNVPLSAESAARRVPTRRVVTRLAPRTAFCPNIRSACLPAAARRGAHTYSTQVHNKSRLFVLSSKLAFLRTSSSSRPFKSESAIPPNKAPNRRLFCVENFKARCVGQARRRPLRAAPTPNTKTVHSRRARQSDGEEVGQSAVGAEAEPREAPASRSRKLECASSVARSRQAAATTRGATACNSTRHR